jgi:phage tail sheath protein FI
MANPTYPGVYIEEFTPGAPIQGVGTSTAAFLGPAKAGPLNVPSKITSWDGFRQVFGEEPLEGPFYLWYAVRGFYENGGKVAYVTRVSNGTMASLVLLDGKGVGTIKIVQKPSGSGATAITVEVKDASAGSGKLFRPTPVPTIVNASGKSVRVNSADAATLFRPTDLVHIESGAKKVDATVTRVEGDTLRIDTDLGAAVLTSGTVRLADLPSNATVIRVDDKGAGLGSGSVISVKQGSTVDIIAVVKSVTAERISLTSGSLTTYRIELKNPLGMAVKLDTDATFESKEFSLNFAWTDAKGVAQQKSFEQLSMSSDHSRWYAPLISEAASLPVGAWPVDPPNATAAPDNRPAVLATKALDAGVADNPASLNSSDYKSALGRLEAIDDVNFICIPDKTDADVQGALLTHCETLKDRVAILDSVRGLPMTGTGSVEEQLAGLVSADGYAALYYPWLQVMPKSGSLPILVPPSGHMAGIYARTDENRGVFKAPAGVEAAVNGALGVERLMSDTDQGELNLKGINVIRVFQAGGRPVVWGARTTSNITSWQYVNIRRLFAFLEESIQEGIRWAVFEPNNLSLWQKLKRTINAFLLTQWRAGALFGEKPEAAFYVRIDEVLNPFSEQALGRLHIEIGVRPSYPAEFIIVRIGIWDGGSQVSEA